MDGSPVGWLCVVPPLLTIACAIISRRVVLSLVAGIVAAIIILLPSASLRQEELGADFTWGQYLLDSSSSFLASFFEEHLWVQLIDEDHMRVFAFTTLLSMQVALIHKMGGMKGIVLWASHFARTRRTGQFMTWVIGLLIFIDDYANMMLLGSTMRPVTDRLKISREKLAFLVDSTSAPVAGLALVSTWVAGEIGYIEDGFQAAGVDIGSQAFMIFAESIPTRFYIIFALLFVLIIAVSGRDYGPMLAAERKAKNADPEAGEGADGAEQENGANASEHRYPPGARPLNAILPILVTVGVVLLLLVLTGRMALEEAGTLPDPAAAAAKSTFERISDWGYLVGNGNSYIALVYGSLAGLVVCLLLNAMQRILDAAHIGKAMLNGFLHVFPALIILWLAWALSGLTGKDYLATGDFLAGLVVQANISPELMPTIIFLVAGGVAFGTGTSWGTMGIVMPIAIPLVIDLLDPVNVDIHHPILLASISGVLAGAIFGDHCSPISDTTILSSRSSDCDHIAHVRTQMPYALTVAAVTILIGTLPVGFGAPAWLLIPLGIASLIGILLAFGRRA